jgi:hypothetical protein
MLSEGSERWAPAQQRTVEETLRCVRARITSIRFFKHWTHLRALAAVFASWQVASIDLTCRQPVSDVSEQVSAMSPD